MLLEVNLEICPNKPATFVSVVGLPPWFSQFFYMDRRHGLWPVWGRLTRIVQTIHRHTLHPGTHYNTSYPSSENGLHSTGGYVEITTTFDGYSSECASHFQAVIFKPPIK